MSYTSTDVFVVCFSVVEPSSFLNIAEKWAPEIKQYCQNIPWILVGTQIDLRDDAVTIKELIKKNMKPITKEEGKQKYSSQKRVTIMFNLNSTKVGQIDPL
jgi:small GTP-binding protein